MVKNCCKDFNIYNVVFFKKIRKNTWTFYTCVPKTSMTWFTVPEIWSVADGNWQFWVIFSPFSLIKTKQIRILKLWKKNCWRYHYIMHVYQKSQSYDVWFLRYGLRQTDFLSFCIIFCPLTTRKIKILRKWKKYLEIL